MEAAIANSPSNKKARSLTIDIIKGINILLVVVGHLIPYDGYVFRLIYSFHMPLFFMLSGYCSSMQFQKRNQNFFRYLWKKIKSIFIQMIFLGICVRWLIGYPMDVFWTQDMPLYILRPDDWFLRTLFYGDILLYLFFQIDIRCRGKWFRHMIPLVLICLTPWILSLSRETQNPFVDQLPFHFGILALCFGFMLIGHLAQELKTSKNIVLYAGWTIPKHEDDAPPSVSVSVPKALLLLLIALIPFLFYTKDNVLVNVATTYIGKSEPMFYGMCFIMSLLIVGTSFLTQTYLRKASKILAFLGRNSLWIYIGHSLANMAMVKLLFAITGTQYTLMVDLPWYWSIAFFFIGLAASLLLIFARLGILELIKCVKKAIQSKHKESV